MNESGLPAPLSLEDRKERAVRRLGAHFAEDHLSVEEFENSVDRVYAAATPREVDGVFEGLPALRAPILPERTGALVPTRRARPEDVPERGFQLALMGGVERTGAWTPARKFTAVAVMGGVGVDLREAALGPGLTELRVIAVMGGIEVIVPPGLAVETRGLGIMGGFDGFDQPSGDPDPDAPKLLIRGVAVMGGVEVTSRLPGESARDAKRRRRQERRALKASG